MMKKARWIALPILAAALLLLLMGLGAAEEQKLSFNLTGKLISDASDAGFFATPDTDHQALFRFGKNEPCQVIGQSGRFYQVIMRGQVGYVAKSRLDLSGERAEGLAEELQILSLADPIPYLNSTNYLSLQGTILLSEPVDTLCIFFWDVRQSKVEKVSVQTYDTPTAIIDAPGLRQLLYIQDLSAGEKILVVEAARNGEAVVLFRSPLYLRGRFKEVAHVTKQCKVSSENVLDYDVDYSWRPSESRPSLTVEIPTTVNAAGMALEWYSVPAYFTVDLYGDGNVLISSQVYATGFYSDWVDLTPAVRKAVITPYGSGVAMSTLRVYEAGYPQELVQRWEPIPEKVDLMVVSTHQDDEWLFLGGTIPYYAYQGKDIAMVYMANCGRNRYREALDSLWTSGLRTHPIFFGLRDILVDTVELSRSLWADKEPEKLLVRAIRQYRPEVMVAQDFKGEYGHPQHILTASLVAQAVGLAADPSFDPESAAQYGVWQVKKLYIHLYEENRIVMDWSVPLDESGVITPIFLATRSFDKHRSQQGYFTMEEHGTVYDNRVFGLYYSSVGPDVLKNDFFENIPAD